MEEAYLSPIKEEMQDIEVIVKEEMINSDSESENNDYNTLDSSERYDKSLSAKTRKRYETVYSAFMEWRSQRLRGVSSFSENVILDYFRYQLEQCKSPISLCSDYFILKKTISVNHNINIEKYSKLRAFLRQNSRGYQPRNTKTLSPYEINKFVMEAPDDIYLVVKVVLIMGVTGACTAHELHSITVNDIKDVGSALLVTLSKRRVNETFAIKNDFYQICKRYINLRPANIKTTSFFLSYRYGKCSSQRIPINAFGAMGKQIATFLKLPSPDEYTAHIFRNSKTKTAFLKSTNPKGYTGRIFKESCETILQVTEEVCSVTNEDVPVKRENEEKESKTEEVYKPPSVWVAALDENEETYVQPEQSDLSDSENDDIGPPYDRLVKSTESLPEKSRKRYEIVYKSFRDWQALRKIDSFCEDILIVYFKELSEKYVSSTLWVNYSMLRSTLSIHHNVNMSSYDRLRNYLKRCSKGFQSTRGQTKTFRAEEINRFIREAPDEIYLVTKVALIIGVIGACRKSELRSLTTKDVQDLGAEMLITILDSVTKNCRQFKITDRFYKICKQYVDLRPTSMQSTAFFVNYQKGKCIAQNIGINKIGRMGIQIAKFLKLPNMEMYTGRCFKKTSEQLDKQGGATFALTLGQRCSTPIDQNCSISKDIQMVDAVKEEIVDSDGECTEELSEISFKEEIIDSDHDRAEKIVTIPEKSRKRYETAYKEFMDWRRLKKLNSFSEDVFLGYFKDFLEESKSPSSLYRDYCILKTMLYINHNVTIGDYSELRTFVNSKYKSHQAKKAKPFTSLEINRFITEASDSRYLVTKVALIMGTVGACSVSELRSLTVKDIQDLGSAMLVTVPKQRTNGIRKFTITDYFYQICKKYANLRPTNVESTSFFMTIRNGKCIVQNIGINTFRAMGKAIAKFLKLPNPEEYTGHSFRRSSSALLLGESKINNGHIDSDSNSLTFEEKLKPDNFHLKVDNMDVCEETLDISIKEEPMTDEDEITEAAVLSEKSKQRYEAVYKTFMDWRNGKGITTFSESVFLDYFGEVIEKYSPSSLWSLYSMLRCTLSANNNVCIEKYAKLRALLKQINAGYQRKQSKTFSQEEINKFISEAPDDVYLAVKVASIIAILGACKMQELHSLTIQNIELLDSAMLVTIPETATKHPRKFIITDHFYTVCKQYIDIRPANAESASLFLCYQNGKCILKNMGIHTFGAMGRQIATFLNLPNPHNYTGASFRKSTTLKNQESASTLKIATITKNESMDTDGESDDRSDIASVKDDIMECDSAIEASPIKSLPEKSKKRYEIVYMDFMDWRSRKNIASFNENVCLHYFKDLAETYTPSSMWTRYSMLRSTLSLNHNINLETYSKLREFLKCKSEGYEGKKMKAFSPEEVSKFLDEAPDDTYLAAKVAVIMEITGPCHKKELYSLNIEDVQDFGSAMLVTVRSKIPRKFAISNPYYHTCKKYVDLRPPDTKCKSFFLNYKSGKCTSQNIGINKLKAVGRQIARFLELPNPETYTGRIF